MAAPPIKERITQVVDVFAMIGVVAGIMMFVRPGSKGPAFVAAVGDAWIAAASGTIGAQLNGSQPAPPRPKSSTKPKKKSGNPFGLPDLTPWDGLLPDLNPFFPGNQNPLDPLGIFN